MTAIEAEELFDALPALGREIAETRAKLEELIDRRQIMVATLRAKGVPLIRCAEALGVNPEALSLRDKRRGPRS